MRGNSGVDNWARGRILSLAGTQRFPLVVAGIDALVSPALPADFTALSDMLGFVFESNAANTGPVTLDIGDGVARVVTHIGGAALIAGDIPGADTVVEVFYDVSSDTFHAQLIRQPSSVAGSKLTGVAAVGVSTRYARADHQHGSAIVGVTDGSSALAGDVGELQEIAVLSTAPLAIASGIVSNVLALPLTAGSWELTGMSGFTGPGAVVAAARAGITNVGGTLPALQLCAGWTDTTGAADTRIRSALPRRIINAAGPWTAYVVAISTFSAAPLGWYGTLTATRYN